MAKDDLKIKDLFTHLVNWIKGKFSEQDTKIAANKYTLPQATETSLGGVKIKKSYKYGVTKPDDDMVSATVQYVDSAVGHLSANSVDLLQFHRKTNPATEDQEGIVKLKDNENSTLYSKYKGTAAGVSHVDNVIKSMEVGMNAQLNLKQDKIKIVTEEPGGPETASDPDGTIYFKV